MVDEHERETADSVQAALGPEWTVERVGAAALIELLLGRGAAPGLALVPFDRARSLLEAMPTGSADLSDWAGAASGPGVPSQLPLIAIIDGAANPHDYFPLVHKRRLRGVVHASYLRDGPLLSRILQTLADPPGVHGLQSLRLSESPVAREQVRELPERHALIDKVCEEAAAAFDRDYQVTEHRLAIEEILNNALFHAFKDKDGRDLYGPVFPDRLRQGRRVAIEYQADSRLFAFSITDNGGTLPADLIRAKIQNQLSGQDLLKGHGRGLFLTFSFSNIFWASLVRGRLTQMVIAFFRRRAACEKLFLIHSDH